MKLSFAFEGAAPQIDPHGQYESPIETTLLHRLTLKDGKVVDLYNGVSDDEVRRIDHETAAKVAEEHVDHEGNPAPLDLGPLPVLDEDGHYVIGDN